MTDDDKAGVSRTAAGLALNEADRALLEQIREQIAERYQTAGLNHVTAPDNAESQPGRRQVADMAAVARESEKRPTAAQTGFDVTFARLLGWDRGGENPRASGAVGRR